MFNFFHSNRKEFLKQKDWQDYKSFAFRDDVIKLTVGVMLANSFNKVINELSNNLIMPFLLFLTSSTGTEWREWNFSIREGLNIKLGCVIGSFLDFLIISIILYFFYIKLMGSIKHKEIKKIEIKECPYCKEVIKIEATVCRYCTKDLSEK